MDKHISIWRRLKQFWDQSGPQIDADRKLGHAPSHVRATFKLCYHDSEIGTLTAAEDGVWTFRYSDNFQKLQETRKIRTITEFPAVDKTYESSELWPFFLMRIPSLRQSSIKETLEKEKIDEHDEARLLERFGRRTVANPFELIAS